MLFNHIGDALACAAMLRQIDGGFGGLLGVDFRLHELQISYTVARDKTPKASGELVICNW